MPRYLPPFLAFLGLTLVAVVLMAWEVRCVKHCQRGPGMTRAICTTACDVAVKDEGKTIQ